MKHYKVLANGQFVIYTAAFLLAGRTIHQFGLDSSSLVPLGLSAVLMAIGWIGPQIVHELCEINDQLAGRSIELHRFLGAIAEKGNTD